MLISLIVPCYNEEEAMPLFYQEACRVAKNMKESHNADFEIIFVDDGSKDGTLHTCLLYTSDAADEEDSVDLGGRRILKKKKPIMQQRTVTW